MWMDGSPVMITMWNDPRFVATDGLFYSSKGMQENTEYTQHHMTSIWKLSLAILNDRWQKACAVLYFISLYEFFWVRISCSPHMERDIFPKWTYICEQKKYRSDKQPSSWNNKWHRNGESILVSVFCIKVGNIWHSSQNDQMTSSRVTQRIFSTKLNKLMNSQNFHVLLSKYLQQSTTVLVVYENKDKSHHELINFFKTNEVLFPNFYLWRSIYFSGNKTGGIQKSSLVLSIKDITKEEMDCHPGTFQCGDKSCIHSTFICHNMKHCPDGKDEEDTTCFHMRNFIVFGTHLLTRYNHSCSTSLRTTSTLSNQTVSMPCHLVSVNRDEMSDIELASVYPSHRVCVHDRSKPYCLETFMASNLLFCKNHICTREFKCPESYCIPHRTVCDGIYDCPGGEDEFECFFRKCSGEYGTLFVTTLQKTVWI